MDQRKKRFSVKKRLYAIDGVDQDWLHHAFGTQAFIVEACEWMSRSVRESERLRVGTRGAWVTLLDRFLDGPSVRLRVVDADDGRPLQAQVTFANMRFFEGEVWRARSDGYWFAYWKEESAVTIQVQHTSYETEKISISPSGGMQTHSVRLRKKKTVLAYP